MKLKFGIGMVTRRLWMIEKEERETHPILKIINIILNSLLFLFFGFSVNMLGETILHYGGNDLANMVIIGAASFAFCLIRYRTMPLWLNGGRIMETRITQKPK